MNKPGYLVEGDLEQKFIQQICPGSPVQKINCNGELTSIQAIAKRVGTLGRLLHKRCSLLVVVFDREGREESAEEIQKQFTAALVQEKIDVPVVVGVPDRNVEVWILADYPTFLQSAGLPPASPVINPEGRNGKTVIKQALGKAQTYVETIQGVLWLKAARPATVQAHSPSFRRLFSALAGLDCWWLRQLELPLAEAMDSRYSSEQTSPVTPTSPPQPSPNAEPLKACSSQVGAKQAGQAPDIERASHPDPTNPAPTRSHL